MECERVLVVRPRCCDTSHRVGKRDVPRFLVAVAVEDLRRAHVRLFALGTRFRFSLGGRRRETGKNLQRGVAILLHPQRVIVSHRLAPVGQGEILVRSLSLAKRFGGQRILEVVQERDAELEWFLSSCAAGVLEVDLADAKIRADRR